MHNIHLMREKTALLLFPTAGRMDHTIPAIRYIQKLAKERGAKKLIVEFLPLNKIVSHNLPKFIQSTEEIHTKELRDEKSLSEKMIPFKWYAYVSFGFSKSIMSVTRSEARGLSS